MKYILTAVLLAATSGFAAPPTIENCMGCHDGSDPQIPALPLDNFQALKNDPALVAKVRQRISLEAGKERMPPNRFLTAPERAEIERYLETGS